MFLDSHGIPYTTRQNQSSMRCWCQSRAHVAYRKNPHGLLHPFDICKAEPDIVLPNGSRKFPSDAISIISMHVVYYSQHRTINLSSVSSLQSFPHLGGLHSLSAVSALYFNCTSDHHSNNHCSSYHLRHVSQKWLCRPHRIGAL